jgi:hypothetical protein
MRASRYERIGRGYALMRREDPEFARRIAATSGFARMNPDVVERVVRSVRRDLESGAWDKRHGHLRHQDTLDVGLRLILNKPMPQPAD